MYKIKNIHQLKDIRLFVLPNFMKRAAMKFLRKYLQGKRLSPLGIVHGLAYLRHMVDPCLRF